MKKMSGTQNPYESPTTRQDEYPLRLRVRRLIGIPFLVLSALLAILALCMLVLMTMKFARLVRADSPVPYNLFREGLRLAGTFCGVALVLGVCGYVLRRPPK
jgi:hypothetical protein